MADRTFCDPSPIHLDLYLSNILTYPVSHVDFLLYMFRVPNFQPSFLHRATFGNIFFFFLHFQSSAEESPPGYLS